MIFLKYNEYAQVKMHTNRFLNPHKAQTNHDISKSLGQNEDNYTYKQRAKYQDNSFIQTRALRI